MGILAPFQLLEINVISAQDLQPVCRKMRTFAVAWVHSERKLATRVDDHGDVNPNWNDKFVFRVDEEFLYGDTSAVMIEIYALHWFRKIHVGTVRVLVGNLVPPMERHDNHHVQLGMRFVALQVWRPSGRPQGILNLGVAIIDSSMRSMPLYMQLGSSAVGYRHLMGEEDPVELNSDNKNHNRQSNAVNYVGVTRPQLRRTKSDSSSIVGSIMDGPMKPRTKGRGGGSIVNGAILDGDSWVNGGSMVNGGGSMVNGGGSMVNGFECRRKKGGSMLNGSEIGFRGKTEKKGGSILNGLDVMESPRKGKGGKLVKQGSMIGGEFNDADSPRFSALDLGYTYKPFSKFSGFDYGGPKRGFWTDSELGPSPSEVAASVAKRYYQRQGPESSVVEGWSLGENMEGLESKMGRWRPGTPRGYSKYQDYSSYDCESSSIFPASTSSRHTRRRTEGDSAGLFSCFGNICGCEISISYGGGGGGGSQPARKERFHRTQSFENLSFL